LIRSVVGLELAFDSGNRLQIREGHPGIVMMDGPSGFVRVEWFGVLNPSPDSDGWLVHESDIEEVVSRSWYFTGTKNRQRFLYPELVGECPKCHRGVVIPKMTSKRRRDNYRDFYGCSEFPQCDFVASQEFIDDAMEQAKSEPILEASDSRGLVQSCDRTTDWLAED